MAEPVVVNLSMPVCSVEVLDDFAVSNESPGSDAAFAKNIEQTNQLKEELVAGKELFSRACQSLDGVVVKINEFYEKLISEHKEQISSLSVEIARKVLARQVEDGDYEIESIIKEALGSTPSQEDVVVHLNPNDFAAWQKVQAENAGEMPSGLKFVSDNNISPAECMLETDKGRIESFISEQLEKIGKALTKTG